MWGTQIMAANYYKPWRLMYCRHCQGRHLEGACKKDDSFNQTDRLLMFEKKRQGDKKENE